MFQPRDRTAGFASAGAAGPPTDRANVPRARCLRRTPALFRHERLRCSERLEGSPCGSFFSLFASHF